MMLRIYDDWKEARQRLLRRRRMGVVDQVPEPMRAAIRRLFGEELTPEAAVARILADVRQCRDEALRAWTARTDGVTIDDFEVPAEALAAAQASLPPGSGRGAGVGRRSAGAGDVLHRRAPLSPLSLCKCLPSLTIVILPSPLETAISSTTTRRVPLAKIPLSCQVSSAMVNYSSERDGGLRDSLQR